MENDALPLSIAAWLLTYALHSTVLIGCAWLAAVGLARRACRSQRLRERLPSLRERLWKVALVGGLVTASIQTALGIDAWGTHFALASETHVARVESAPRATTDVQSAEALAPTITFLRTAAPSPEPVENSPEWRDEGRSAARSPVVLSALPTRTLPTVSSGTAYSAEPFSSVRDETVRPAQRTIAATISASSASLWLRVILVLWVVGVAFGLARWACQWNRLLRRLDDREPVVDGRLHDIYERLRLRSKARANTKLSIAPGISAPITLGLRTLEICLPPRVAEDLQHEEIEALLAHELAHAERRDPMWLALCRFVEVVFFFQPLNKVCSTWLEDEAEYLCDDWAIVQVGERIALASCLTEIAGWIVHDREPVLASAMAARGTRLTTRVRRLLDEDHEPTGSSGSAWITVFGSASALGVALLVPGVSAAPTRAYDEDLSRRMDTLEASLTATDPTTITASASDASTTKAPSRSHSTVRFGDLFAHVAQELAQSLTAAAPSVPSPVAGTVVIPIAPPRTTDILVHALIMTRATTRPDLSTTLDELDRELETLHAELVERGTTDELDAHFAELERELEHLHERAAQLEALLQPASESNCDSTPCNDTPNPINIDDGTKDES